MPAAHVARVLDRLTARGLGSQLHPSDPIQWVTRCPCCAGPLEVRDVLWQSHGRRIILYCPRDPEPAVLAELRLAERDLYLNGAAPARSHTATAGVKLIERLTRALGAPVSTPERVTGAHGQLERAPYRVHRWSCPACHAGSQIYRPLVVDSDGRLFCDASHCSPEAIGRAVKARLNAVTA